MKLKHMTVQRTYVPEMRTTVFYAFGVDDGRMYESHFELPDSAAALAIDSEQLNWRVTNGLTDGIRVVSAEELAQRDQEMRGGVLQ